jgi:hypothetical protein
MTDLEIINELRGAVSLYKKRTNRELAERIDKILAESYLKTNEESVKAISRIKRLINGITNQCSLKYTKRILIVMEAIRDEAI